MTPDKGEVLVTGASGGVGSMAVALLSKCGFEVVGASGKAAAKNLLMHLGAKSVISRAAALDDSGRPLLKARWAGAVDTVGGAYLATALKSTRQRAVVTCCGNVAAANLETTVYPFILRGVRLIGIDSASCPYCHRLEVWQKLAEAWKLDSLDTLAAEISLAQLDENIEQMLNGESMGRKIVALDG